MEAKADAAVAEPAGASSTTAGSGATVSAGAAADVKVGAEISAASSATATADVKSDAETKSATFTVKVVGTGKGSMFVTVREEVVKVKTVGFLWDELERQGLDKSVRKKSCLLNGPWILILDDERQTLQKAKVFENGTLDVMPKPRGS